MVGLVAVRPDSVLNAVQLPASVTNLNSGLTNMDGDDFLLHISGSKNKKVKLINQILPKIKLRNSKGSGTYHKLETELWKCPDQNIATESRQSGRNHVFFDGKELHKNFVIRSDQNSFLGIRENELCSVKKEVWLPGYVERNALSSNLRLYIYTQNQLFAKFGYNFFYQKIGAKIWLNYSISVLK